MKEEIIKIRLHKEFAYEITIEENPVSPGDYIFDFHNNSIGADPVFQCDSSYFAELINKEHQKPMTTRRSAKIIASNDPALNAAGVPRLKPIN